MSEQKKAGHSEYQEIEEFTKQIAEQPDWGVMSHAAKRRAIESKLVLVGLIGYGIQSDTLWRFCFKHLQHVYTEPIHEYENGTHMLSNIINKMSPQDVIEFRVIEHFIERGDAFYRHRDERKR